MKRYGGAVAFPATAVSRRIKIHLLSGISTGEGPELIRNGSVCPACGAVSYEYFQFENAARLKPYDLSFRGKTRFFRLLLAGDAVPPPHHEDRNSPVAGLFLLFAQPGDARQKKLARSPALSNDPNKSFRGRDGGSGGKGGPLFQKGPSLPPGKTPTADRQPQPAQQR